MPRSSMEPGMLKDTLWLQAAVALYYHRCYRPKLFCFCGNTELSFPNVIDSCQVVESQNKDKFSTVCTNDTVHCAGCEVSSCHSIITNKINSSPFSRWARLPWCCSTWAPANSDQQNPISKKNVQSEAVIRANCCLRNDFLLDINFWEQLSPGDGHRK